MTNEEKQPISTPAELTPVETPGRVEISNIIVATDFSPASERALDYALAIARRYDAHVYIVHAIRPDLYTLRPPEAASGMIELVRQSAEQEMAGLLVSGACARYPIRW